jgi:hypothetical protein
MANHLAAGFRFIVNGLADPVLFSATLTTTVFARGSSRLLKIGS